MGPGVGVNFDVFDRVLISVSLFKPVPVLAVKVSSASLAIG